MNENYPIVSVVIPLFNQRPEYLRAAINSAIAQPYKNLEIVISDNHSTNGCSQIFAEYSDSRVRVVCPPTHLSMPENFSFAAEHSRGKYLTFLPSDDILEKNWLEVVLPIMEANDDVVLVFGEVAGTVHDDTEKIIYYNRKNEFSSGKYSPEELLESIVQLDRKAGWVIGGLLRREAYFSAGGMAQPNYKLSFDLSLLLRLLEQGNFFYVANLVGRHRVWGKFEGKNDGERGLRAVDDAVRLLNQISDLELVENNPKLKKLIASARCKKALQLSLVILQSRAIGGIEKAETNEVRLRIASLCRNFGIDLVLYLVQQDWIVAIVKRYYPALKKLYHLIAARLF